MHFSYIVLILAVLSSNKPLRLKISDEKECLKLRGSFGSYEVSDGSQARVGLLFPWQLKSQQDHSDDMELSCDIPQD